ncbi:MAG: endonuclease/exonuclease/phosphatase family protein [Acutalibacteraceae bacterium]
MKIAKKIVAVLFAVLFSLTASAAVSAAGAAGNTFSGSVLDFVPLKGDVNIDGYLNLKDLVRYKKYTVSYDGATIDEEVADFNGDGEYNGADLIGLQLAIIERIFGTPMPYNPGTSNPSDPSEPDDNPNATVPMRNMSFNIRYQEVTDTRVDLVIHMIDLYAPDTIGFQEATPQWMNILKNRLGDRYGYIGKARANTGADNDEANPVFYLKSKFNFIDGATKWLSDTPDKVGSKVPESSLPRIVTYALLEDKATGKRFIHANTHLHHKSEEARIKQSQILLNLLSQFNTNNVPFIITGDFNCSAGSLPYNIYINAGLSNGADIAKTALKGPTFNDYGNASTTIDFFFLPANRFEVDYYKVCNETFVIDGKTTYPSDHYPIILDVKY